MDLQSALMSTGLTGYEARLYAALLAEGAMSGYEAAKVSGISRSNVYVALEGLLEKGGAYRMEGEVTRYTAVPVVEYCANRARALDAALDFIRSHAPVQKGQPDAYITIHGDGMIIDKMKNMIAGAEKRLYASLDTRECGLVIRELQTAVARGIRVVLITSPPVTLEGAEIYCNPTGEPGRIRLITDSAFVLTGELSGPQRRAACLYTANRTLITLFKEALKNEMALHRAARPEESGHGPFPKIETEG